MASRMPRMMMTTRSSMRVKPLSSPASRCRILLVIQVLLPWGRSNEVDSDASARSPTLSDPRTGGKKGAPLGAPFHLQSSSCLADSVDDRGTRPVLAPGRAADRALDAVRDRRRCVRERELRGDELRVVVVTEVRDGHAGVAGRVAGADVVSVVGLDRRDCGADVGLGSRVVRAIAEAQVRGDRDGEQDAENDDDNEELDEGETAFLTGEPLPDLAGHSGAPSMGHANEVTTVHRRSHPR